MSKPRPILEVIAEDSFVVFHGSEHEASPRKLSGVVRLTTFEPMTISKPRIRLEGCRKISWWYAGSLSAGEVTNKREIWSEEKKMGGIESPHKIMAGVIEWAFEFELSPSMPESVEGLANTYLIYHLHATVSKQGWNARDISARQRIRIVRTLGAAAMETTRSRTNTDIWANKISYNISIPTDAVVFGTSITADIELSPLKSGLRIGTVELCLLETIVKRIQTTEMPDSRSDRSKTVESEVATEELDFPEDSRVKYDDESVDNPTMQDEMYRFKATLPLPDSLNLCRQDVDSHAINISHKFKLSVNLHNPEGHVSQLVCRLPVKLFISPNLPLNESNQVCRPVNGASDAELNSFEVSSSAPPQYGQHQLDELFSDIDLNGHLTRNASVIGSPSGLGARSRSGSPERSSNGYSGDDVSGRVFSHRHALPSLLQSRLADLQEDTSLEYDSPQVSAAPSRRNSHDGHPIDIRQVDYDLNNLSRVPSYNRAVQSSGVSSPRDGPPTYFEATSRPSSPSQRARQDTPVGSWGPASYPRDTYVSPSPLSASMPSEWGFRSRRGET